MDPLVKFCIGLQTKEVAKCQELGEVRCENLLEVACPSLEAAALASPAAVSPANENASPFTNSACKYMAT